MADIDACLAEPALALRVWFAVRCFIDGADEPVRDRPCSRPGADRATLVTGRCAIKTTWPRPIAASW